MSNPATQFTSERNPGGGKRLGAGRPRKADLDAKQARLEEWEKRLRADEGRFIEAYKRKSHKDVRVMVDRRKASLPDAKSDSEVTISGPVSVTVKIEGNEDQPVDKST